MTLVGSSKQDIRQPGRAVRKLQKPFIKASISVNNSCLFFISFHVFKSINTYIYIYINTICDKILCPTTHYCLKYIPPTRTSRKDVLIVNAGNGQPDMAVGPDIWHATRPGQPEILESAALFYPGWFHTNVSHQAVIPICACFSNLGHIAQYSPPSQSAWYRKEVERNRKSSL